jgi:hypothetical protein
MKCIVTVVDPSSQTFSPEHEITMSASPPQAASPNAAKIIIATSPINKESATKKAKAEADYVVELESSSSGTEDKSPKKDKQQRDIEYKKCKANADFSIEFASSDEDDTEKCSKHQKVDQQIDSKQPLEQTKDNMFKIASYGDRNKALTVVVGVGDGIILESDDDYNSYTSGYSARINSLKRYGGNSVTPLGYDSDDYLSSSSAKSLGSDNKSKYLRHLSYGYNGATADPIFPSSSNKENASVVVAAPLNGFVVQSARMNGHSDRAITLDDSNHHETTGDATATTHQHNFPPAAQLVASHSVPQLVPSVHTKASDDPGTVDSAASTASVVTTGSLYATGRQRDKKSGLARGFVGQVSRSDPKEGTGGKLDVSSSGAGNDERLLDILAANNAAVNELLQLSGLVRSSTDSVLLQPSTSKRDHDAAEITDEGDAIEYTDADFIVEEELAQSTPLLADNDTEEAIFSTPAKSKSTLEKVNDFDGDSIYDFSDFSPSSGSGSSKYEFKKAGKSSVAVQATSGSNYFNASSQQSSSFLFGSFVSPNSQQHGHGDRRKMETGLSSTDVKSEIPVDAVEDDDDEEGCLAFEMQDLAHIDASRYSKDVDSVEGDANIEDAHNYSSDEFEEFKPLLDNAEDSANPTGATKKKKKNRKKKKKKSKSGDIIVNKGTTDDDANVTVMDVGQTVPKTEVPGSGAGLIEADAIDKLCSTIDRFKSRYLYVQPTTDEVASDYNLYRTSSISSAVVPHLASVSQITSPSLLTTTTVSTVTAVTSTVHTSQASSTSNRPTDVHYISSKPIPTLRAEAVKTESATPALQVDGSSTISASSKKRNKKKKKKAVGSASDDILDKPDDDDDDTMTVPAVVADTPADIKVCQVEATALIGADSTSCDQDEQAVFVPELNPILDGSSEDAAVADESDLEVGTIAECSTFHPRNQRQSGFGVNEGTLEYIAVHAAHFSQRKRSICTHLEILPWT